MDSLCISLVHQYLESTKSALADQFKNKYQPQETNVEVKEVLTKWKEEQLVRGLIYQHLKTVTPSLAVEFRNRHCCSREPSPMHLMGEIQEQLLAIASKGGIGKGEDESEGEREQENRRKNNTFTTEEQMVRGLIYQHLKTVAPSLADEFRDRHWCSVRIAPKYCIIEIQKKVSAIANTGRVNKVEAVGGGKQEGRNGRKVIRRDKNTYTSEELVRIRKAMANDEDIVAVAKEMGRTYNSVLGRCDK